MKTLKSLVKHWDYTIIILLLIYPFFLLHWNGMLDPRNLDIHWIHKLFPDRTGFNAAIFSWSIIFILLLSAYTIIRFLLKKRWIIVGISSFIFFSLFLSVWKITIERNKYMTEVTVVNNILVKAKQGAPQTYLNQLTPFKWDKVLIVPFGKSLSFTNESKKYKADKEEYGKYNLWVFKDIASNKTFHIQVPDVYVKVNNLLDNNTILSKEGYLSCIDVNNNGCSIIVLNENN